jgi:CheY-like chemotaxis protein
VTIVFKCRVCGGTKVIKEGVLVVEDNKTTRDILRTILESEGYAVTCCADGSSAIDIAKEKGFNAFLVDYRMSAMNGVEATAVLRRLHPEKFIIGFSIENKEQDFLEAGADVFVRKDDLYRWLVEGDLKGLRRNRRGNTMSNSGL